MSGARIEARQTKAELSGFHEADEIRGAHRAYD